MAEVRLIDANPIEATPIYTTSCNEDYVSGYLDGANAVMSMVHNAPTIDPQSLRPVAQWEGQYDGYSDGEPVYDVWECSNCGHTIDDGTDCKDDLPNYCPACGAKMEENA